MTAEEIVRHQDETSHGKVGFEAGENALGWHCHECGLGGGCPETQNGGPGG